jgi:CRP-like cAMP-binding protein
MKPLDANLKLKLRTLRGNPYFDNLPEEMLNEIAGHMQLRGFERGEVLFWEGDP